MTVRELIGLLQMCQPEEEVRLMLVQGIAAAVVPAKTAIIRIGNGIILSNQDADKWMERKK